VGDLASLGLTERGYREIGRRVGELKRQTFFVLEGGYQGENVGEDIHRLLEAFEASSQ
jgi:acetoin utilization deacetylase AcuC-like enzyme